MPRRALSAIPAYLRSSLPQTKYIFAPTELQKAMPAADLLDKLENNLIAKIRRNRRRRRKRRKVKKEKRALESAVDAILAVVAPSLETLGGRGGGDDDNDDDAKLGVFSLPGVGLFRTCSVFDNDLLGDNGRKEALRINIPGVPRAKKTKEKFGTIDRVLDRFGLTAEIADIGKRQAAIETPIFSGRPAADDDDADSDSVRPSSASSVSAPSLPPSSFLPPSSSSSARAQGSFSPRPPQQSRALGPTAMRVENRIFQARESSLQSAAAAAAARAAAHRRRKEAIEEEKNALTELKTKTNEMDKVKMAVRRLSAVKTLGGLTLQDIKIAALTPRADGAQQSEGDPSGPQSDSDSDSDSDGSTSSSGSADSDSDSSASLSARASDRNPSQDVTPTPSRGASRQGARHSPHPPGRGGVGTPPRGGVGTPPRSGVGTPPRGGVGGTPRGGGRTYPRGGGGGDSSPLPTPTGPHPPATSPRGHHGHDNNPRKNRGTAGKQAARFNMFKGDRRQSHIMNNMEDLQSLQLLSNVCQEKWSTIFCLVKVTNFWNQQLQLIEFIKKKATSHSLSFWQHRGHIRRLQRAARRFLNGRRLWFRRLAGMRIARILRPLVRDKMADIRDHCADIIVKILHDTKFNFAVFASVIHSYRRNVKLCQRAARTYIKCRRARMEVLRDWWIHIERDWMTNWKRKKKTFQEDNPAMITPAPKRVRDHLLYVVLNKEMFKYSAELMAYDRRVQETELTTRDVGISDARAVIRGDILLLEHKLVVVRKPFYNFYTRVGVKTITALVVEAHNQMEVFQKEMDSAKGFALLKQAEEVLIKLREPVQYVIGLETFEDDDLLNFYRLQAQAKKNRKVSMGPSPPSQRRVSNLQSLSTPLRRLSQANVAITSEGRDAMLRVRAKSMHLGADFSFDNMA